MVLTYDLFIIIFTVSETSKKLRFRTPLKGKHPPPDFSFQRFLFLNGDDIHHWAGVGVHRGSPFSFRSFSPVGMSEGDVVPLRPACKHLLLGDEAVVVSSSAALVQNVRDTFVEPSGFVVVIGHLLGS